MPQRRLTKDGKVRWIGRYSDSTRKEHSRTFDKKSDATEWERLNHRASKLNNDWLTPGDETTTVKELVTEWANAAPRPSTRSSRIQLAHNLGDLANVRIRDARPHHFATWATYLRDGRPWADGKPLGPRSITNRLSQMRGIFDNAKNDGRIERDPTISLRKFNAGHADKVTIPSQDDVTQYLLHAPSKWFHTAVRLAAEAGLRAGEVAGLRIRDLDQQTNTLHIRVQDHGKPLKSKDSQRDIPISDSLKRELVGHIGKRSNPDGPILRGKRGRTLNSVVIGDMMVTARQRTPVDRHLTFHSFRHYFASRMIANLVPIPTVSMLLGHSTVSMTLDTYSHHLPDQDEVARDNIEKMAGAGWDL